MRLEAAIGQDADYICSILNLIHMHLNIHAIADKLQRIIHKQ